MPSLLVQLICLGHFELMQITFLGTRGEIEPKTRRHRMHTSTLLIHRNNRVMIDCGTTWVGKIGTVQPDAIVLTHAHPDHAFGLQKGAPCPVWATRETWDYIDKFPIPHSLRRLIRPRKAQRIGGITFEAFPVWHSVRCPAVGYRITCGKACFFYVPDVAYIPDIEEAFKKIRFYIGDGAAIWRKMIRKHKVTGEIFGHANIRQQLTWCRKQHVAKMIVTHCGSDIVAHEKQAILQIEKFAKEKGIDVQIAYDGWQIKLS